MKLKLCILILGLNILPSGYASLDFIPTNLIVNNMSSGTLTGMVKFAQTHTIDPNNNSSLKMPRLVSNRDTLLIFMPTGTTKFQAMNVTAYRKDGAFLGTIQLLPPSLQPKTDKLTPPTAAMPDVIYSEKAWTGILPGSWISPGFYLVLNNPYDSKTGTLNNIDVGASNELVIHNVRIGMLTPPRTEDRLENEPLLAADYFQKIPVSHLVVANYSPVYLDKIVLPNGTVYTTQSADNGGVYNGDMREYIAKNLISIGINNANYGITSTDGINQWQPEYFNEIVVHIARGNYANGIVDHGLSGGNGMATLFDTVGNEFSHELGHAYGLGHYTGGGRWSTHNPLSGWGWDALRNRFIANFFWDQTGNNVAFDGYVTPPMGGIYLFNNDAMAGGVASSPLSNYTLHTGYSTQIIQNRFEATGRTSQSVPSGYIVWSENTKQMVERRDPNRRKSSMYGVNVTTLVGFYDPTNALSSYVYPALYGSYGHVYQYDPPGQGDCFVQVRFNDNTISQIPVANSRINGSVMNKFHINVPTSKGANNVDVICPDKSTKINTVLTTRVIDPPLVQPKPAVSIGEDDSYRHIAQLIPTFRALGKFRVSSYKTIEDFELDLIKYYPQILKYNSNNFFIEIYECYEAQPTPGHVYVMDNSNDLTRDYFVLLSNNFENPPPADRMNTADWKYIGSAETYVNFSLNPLIITKAMSSNNDDTMKQYYNVNTIYPEASISQTTVDRQIFYKDLSTQERLYFMQRNAGMGGALPSSKASTIDWYYMGSSTDIQTIKDATIDQFDTFVKSWYKQDSLGNWGDNNRQGVIGTIFRYDNLLVNTIDYFKLKTTTYWYFPIDHTSNDQWEYIGSYYKK